MASDPLDEALARLVAEGVLSPDQARRVGAELRPLETRSAAAPTTREGVVEILAYAGGALVIAAVGVLGAMWWDDVGRAGQLLGVFGSAALLLAGAVLLGGATPSRLRLRRTLAALAACAAGIGGVIVAQIATEGIARDQASLGGALGLLAVSVPAYLAWRGSALVAAWFAGGWLLTLHLLTETGAGWEGARPLVFFLAYGALVCAVAALLPERDLAVALGLASAALGAAVPAWNGSHPWLALVAGIAIAVVAFAVFAVRGSPATAAVGAVTALVVPPSAVAAITDDAASVAAVLAVTGAALIVGAVLRSRRRRQPAGG